MKKFKVMVSANWDVIIRWLREFQCLRELRNGERNTTANFSYVKYNYIYFYMSGINIL